MGRANRLKVDAGIFHVTHRCHNKNHLLKFAKDRNAYRRKLFDVLKDVEVSVFDYTVTSNHVHLLLEALDKNEISRLMRKVAGEFARDYNRRKGRLNAFWGDSFHATLVQDGKYLYECLLYIELNMVRCGVVTHPKEWEWVGYHEIMGSRQRYCLLDLDRLCWRLGTDSVGELRRMIEFGLSEKIARGEHARVDHWTEALGVGSREFLEKFQRQMFTRLESEIEERAGDIFVLKEEPASYSDKMVLKNTANVNYSG